MRLNGGTTPVEGGWVDRVAGLDGVRADLHSSTPDGHGRPTGGITSVIDGLERAGYVAHRPEGNDRRRLLIEVTDATRERDRLVCGGPLKLAEKIATRYEDRDPQTVRGFIDEISRAATNYAVTLSRR